MTAAILRGTLAQVLAALYAAPRGITVKEWCRVRGETVCTGCWRHIKYCACNRRNSGKQGG